MRWGRATTLLICGIAAAAAPMPPAQAQEEMVITARCALAIGTAMRMLQRDFLLHEPPAVVAAGFEAAFLRNYTNISCYEDAEGFVLYFRPPQYAASRYGNGLYMVRMRPDHTIDYATPLR
jgi:hypothetical protein